MEAEFDEQIVIRKYLAAIDAILARPLQPREDDDAPPLRAPRAI
jgi:hypothetical protein